MKGWIPLLYRLMGRAAAAGFNSRPAQFLVNVTDEGTDMTDTEVVLCVIVAVIIVFGVIGILRDRR